DRQLLSRLRANLRAHGCPSAVDHLAGVPEAITLVAVYLFKQETAYELYLQWNGDVIAGNTAADALVTFSDGDATWTPNEIVDIDVGLRWLLARTGNTRMLRLSNGNPISVYREHNAGSDILADNRRDGTIDIA